MSTGFSKSFTSSSENCFFCARCEEDKRKVEAAYFCTDCKETFCNSCNVLHGNFYKRHTVLGSADAKQWKRQKTPVVMTTCGEHKGTKIEKFCNDHDVVCCYICASDKHGYCKVADISDVASDIMSKPEFTEVMSKVCRIITQLSEHTATRESTLATLRDSHDATVDSVESMKERLIETVGALQQALLDQLKAILDDISAPLLSEINTLASLYGQLSVMSEMTLQRGSSGETSAFIAFNKSKKLLPEADGAVKGLVNIERKIVFSPNIEFEQMLSSLTSLGQLTVLPSKATDKRKCDVRMGSDNSSCNITGCCALPDGNVALVDQKNRKVKLIDKDCVIIADIAADCKPIDLCYVGEFLIAVTCGELDKSSKPVNKGSVGRIKFYNAENGHLQLVRSIDIAHDCYGIGHHGEHLFVGSKTALYRYTMTGQLVMKLYEDTTPSSSYSNVRRFDISEDGKKVYIPNANKSSLVTIDAANGSVLSKLNDKDLRCPTDVSAGNGSVFVSGEKSHTVLQVNEEGTMKLTTLVSGSDGIKNPLSLTFNSRSSELVVGQNNSNDLLVFKLR